MSNTNNEILKNLLLNAKPLKNGVKLNMDYEEFMRWGLREIERGEGGSITDKQIQSLINHQILHYNDTSPNEYTAQKAREIRGHPFLASTRTKANKSEREELVMRMLKGRTTV